MQAKCCGDSAPDTISEVGLGLSLGLTSRLVARSIAAVDYHRSPACGAHDDAACPGQRRGAPKGVSDENTFSYCEPARPAPPCRGAGGPPPAPPPKKNPRKKK